MASANEDRHVWDRHWQALDDRSPLFGRLASLVRRRILRGAVGHYTDRYLPAHGVLVEAGCGTGEASASVSQQGRRLVGLDVSLAALLGRRGQPPFALRIAGDLRRLPFADGSLAGIWNLGVMEHFPHEQGVTILRELRRVLAPGATAIFFWPPELGSSRWVLAPIEWLRSIIGGRRFRFFPDEVNRLRSRRHARNLLAEAGLETVTVDLTARDAFIHLVVVARKPGAPSSPEESP